MKIWGFATALLLSTTLVGQTPQGDSLMVEGRELFYQSVESDEFIDPAIHIFTGLQSESNQYYTTATTYIGALTCLKGKHAFWPRKKFEYVNEGLKIMDEALAQDPNNLEGLFIRATTTYYLPFFFHRKEQSQQDMRNLSRLILEFNTDTYPEDLVQNVIGFLRENAELSDTQSRELLTMQSEMEQK